MSSEKTVLVRIKHSVGVGGKYYHPNSKGVRMPIEHAQSIGAEIIDQKKPSKKGNGSELPEDFPGLDVLIENGADTIEKILAVEDLTDFKGIGKKTAEDILKELQQS